MDDEAEGNKHIFLEIFRGSFCYFLVFVIFIFIC